MTVARPRVRAKTAARGYGHSHQARRAFYAPIVAEGRTKCPRCGETIRPTDPWDLGHVDGDRSRYTGPEHRWCNRSTSGRRPWVPAPPPELPPERDGLAVDDPRWNVPWLEVLRDVPENAVWPRLMTVPHPRAVDSLGPEFCEWAELRENRPLRWWQMLVAFRLLEVDAEGRLVWETLLLTMARQLGKSWLLRELILWRMHQGKRFGETQDVLHTGKDLGVCNEVLRPAMGWAEGQPWAYHVRRVNGDQSIEFMEDHSRWLVRAKGSAFGLTVSVGAVDEAWKVKPHVIDEGVSPTMVEREQPQLWLISTAHRAATSLMLTRRAAAIDALENGEDGDLLIEWSAPRRLELEDVTGWREASPHWTAQRERLVRKQLAMARAGELEPDPEEPDPIEAFRGQWLNQWPQRKHERPLNVKDLLPAGLWDDLAEPGVTSSGPVWVALEDNAGKGAAVAAVGMTDDGRMEVDGWLCSDWDSAVDSALGIAAVRPVRRLLVGASLLARFPRWTSPAPVPAGSRETVVALALFRDLATGGALVHDPDAAGANELDDAMGQAQVKELLTGLQLVPHGPIHLVKAVVWAVHAAHKPAPIPAIR